MATKFTATEKSMILTAIDYRMALPKGAVRDQEFLKIWIDLRNKVRRSL
jgi:hypothetical protein